MANTLKYTNGTGPAFVDGTTSFTATFDVQSLTADRTFIYPDAGGTIALLGSPAFTGNPTAPTQSAGNSSTRLATTEFVATSFAPLATPTFTGDVNASTGNVLVSTAGKGLRVKEGSNAKQGTATLVLGTAVVSNTSVTANSRIFLTAQSLGTVTAPSALAVSARTASTSFTILASDLTDTSVVAWEIFEPA